MSLRVKVGGTVLNTTVVDCQASRDLLAQLPLTLKMKDYDGKEKVSNRIKRLSTSDSPSGCHYNTGDIIYFAGSLCVVYNMDQYYEGVVKLARLNEGIENFQVKGTVEATFELE